MLVKDVVIFLSDNATVVPTFHGENYIIDKETFDKFLKEKRTGETLDEIL